MPGFISSITSIASDNYVLIFGLIACLVVGLYSFKKIIHHLTRLVAFSILLSASLGGGAFLSYQLYVAIAAGAAS